MARCPAPWTLAIGMCLALGCGDRSPPAMWPEPPPPTLAEPIGVGGPSAPAEPGVDRKSESTPARTPAGEGSDPADDESGDADGDAKAAPQAAAPATARPW